MQFFPSRAIFLQIGSLTIRWYAICILTGALITYFISSKKVVKAGYDADIIDDIFVGVLVTGIACARLWYCLFYDFKGYFSHPLSVIAIWDGGLAIHGGLIGGVIWGIIYSKVKKVNFLHLADIILPNVLLAQAVGRWGNFFNQEAFGGIVSESYYDGILSFLKEGMYINYDYRQPMFFYECILCILGWLLISLYRHYKKPKRGDGVFCYLSWYGLIRYWIESQRTDSLMIGNFRTAQLVSISFLVVGLLGLAGVFDKMINSKKPTIVFDLDGTLINTYKLIGDTFLHVFKQHDPSLTFTEKQIVDFLGPTLEETFIKYLPQLDAKELVAEYKEWNNAHHDEYVTLFDNVKEMLDYCKSNGYKMAIASSKMTETVLKGLRATGIEEYFDAIVGVEKVKNHKPAKDGIIKALEEVGGSRDNAIYIGDSVGDVLASQNAGVYAVAYCSSELRRQDLIDAKPNALIDDMAQFIEILKETDHQWTSNLM